jgi:hypothetical protein
MLDLFATPRVLFLLDENFRGWGLRAAPRLGALVRRCRRLAADER